MVTVGAIAAAISAIVGLVIYFMRRQDAPAEVDNAKAADDLKVSDRVTKDIEKKDVDAIRHDLS